ncbi:amino acid adenylation domain-containing protein [Streptomyces halobius]|uniref:Amino acid adenylation domain-containing protein n=1 Tax=Streptomyces halobius TaxID=2879846 RepID=A0ABY4MKG2_9ACTN|nr:non-ribosomal peptide synthetase [Streptomyces halobius]UQA97199.1 amino acid adenylation domain-containing protein [Streptomyces halobius]
MSSASPIPLTAYQRDIWTASSQVPDLPRFNIGGALRLSGKVDFGVLKECCRRAMRKNDAFHLRFAERGGIPVQWTDIDIPEIEVVDVSGEADPRAACLAWMERSNRRPLALDGGRLFDLALLRESESVGYLYVTAHHIITDGWGMDQFSQQVLSDYAHVMRTGIPLESTPPSFLASAEKEARYRGSSPWQRDRDFHRETFADLSPPLFSARATGGAPDGTRRSARHSFLLDRKLIDRIRERESSVFAFLTAAFATYLSRVHRCEEVVLGVPFLNRHGRAERRTVGQFVNMLPLRVAAQGERSMQDIATQIMASTFATKRHERLALGDLLRTLPSRGTGPRRLYDVTVSYLRLPKPENIPGLSVEKVALAHGHDQDALTVYIREYDDIGDVRVDLDYALDVFDEDFPVEAAARHIETLLKQAVDRAEEPVANLPMLAPEEHEDLVRTRNATDAPYPGDTTLHGLFEEQAARTPDRNAIAAGATHPALTYAELDARANQVARGLRAEGVRPDDRVAVLLERGPELLVALLGVLKAGGAYVPVDPAYPADRIRLLLDDCGAKVVLTAGRDGRGEGGPALQPRAPGVRVLPLDALRQGSGAPLEEAAGPHHLAYVIYTSGSTGKPKGVMVEHHSVVNRLAWMQKRYPVGDADVLLQKTPSSFDVSVWELFWWAVEGARVALLEAGGEREPREILRTIAEQRVTVVHFVPSMFGPFIDLLESDTGLPGSIARLRFVFCSGEALPPALVERFHRVFAAAGAPAPRLVNLYGPTEATVDVSYFDLGPGPDDGCAAGPDRPVQRVPIGRPIDNIRLYVLGRHDEPQPVGVPGELCIAGVGLARGYLGRPELTRSAFVDDPFRPGERMYRTGDLARWLADGTVEYLGRIDEQVKIRGNRVELGEVQSRLAAFPGVRDAVAAARTSASRGVHLVGYYVADEDADPTRLRAHLGTALPEFMIPSHFVRIDRIPLTPNGKADRRALPAPPRAGAMAETAPQGAAEATLAAIWGEVLEVDSVGVHDNYFALGGDSILMLRIRAEAERRGLHFTVGDMLRHPTVAELAAHASMGPSAEVPADPAPESFALVPGVDRARLAAAEDAYPVTRLQLGMLYHSSEHEKSAVYHDVFRYTLELDWDEAAFRQAHARLVARHPVLRSSFDLSGSAQPLQIVHRAADAVGTLGIADLRSRSAEAAAAEVREHIERRRHHRYAFDRPPLCLFRVHILPSGAVDLVFSFHHALLDGWSVANLLRELLQDYLHALGQDMAPVADTPLPSFAAHVRDERRALDSEDTRRYWRDALGSAPPARLETFRPHQAPGDDGFVVRHAALPDRLAAAVRGFAHTHELPVKSLLFAAHCLTLRLLQGSDEVTTGLVTHGRPERAEGERVAGLFLNTMPVRLGGTARTWLDAVREVDRRERESHPHRRYPLSAIQAQGGTDTCLQTAFNYVNFHVLGPLLRTAGVRLAGVEIWEQTNFPLLVNAITDPRNGRLELRIDGDGRIVTASQAELFGRRYIEILRRIVERPDETPDFGFLTEEPGDVVRRFERQALHTPRAVAVALSGERWTYEELDRAADRVARRLLSLGAPPGARIGVAMDRSPETVAVVLGIAKAGAACVPLDVSYPEERIAAMLAQAQPFRVIAHAGHARLVPDASAVLPAESVTAGPDRDPGDGPPHPLPPIPPESVAYVLFTSGSTGRPKSVAMPHRSLANLVTWQNRVPSGAVGGTTLQFAPLGFDVSFQEIFSTLCGGGTLRLVSEEQRRDMPALLRLIDREGVERVFLPYVALQQLAEAAEALDLRPRRLRVLVSSGEQLRVTEEIRRLCGELPGCLLENQYGPTETHVVTSFPMTGDPAAFPDLPPIGRPIDGVEVQVLDARLRLVPEGGKGEIYLGGACLAEGYEGQPELTRERFVPHPLRPDGARLYRTGDLGRVLPGGAVVCLERADAQVKIRGFRVEPGEVELALMKLAEHHPGLREAAVVARRPGGAPAFLAAFLVGDEASVDLGDVRRRLRATLPEYLVPSRFAWLPGLPLTPSGKRDDAALRAIALEPPPPSAGRTPPRDAYERGLAEMLSELLQVPQPGVHDDFFELGGTSLTAMRLVVMIEKRYGAEVPLSAFVEAPTVAALADRLRSGSAAADFDPLVPLRASGTRPPLFFVHPIGGNVLCYVRLAQRLPEDQPCYALQAAGAEPGTEPLRSVPDLARSYLDAVRRVQPSGPYTIGGWSFGGFVAFEMARQLRSSGATVDRLVLLDSITPAGRLQGVAEDQLLEWFLWELLWLERGGDAPAQPLPPGLGEQERFDYILHRAVEAGVLPPGGSTARVRRLFRVFRANWQALLDYRPDTCDQDLTLLRATAPLPKVLEPAHHAVGSAHRDPANGWGTWTSGRIDVVDVPGDHLQLMEEPCIATVARRIREVTR